MDSFCVRAEGYKRNEIISLLEFCGSPFFSFFFFLRLQQAGRTDEILDATRSIVSIGQIKNEYIFEYWKALNTIVIEILRVSC